MSLVKSQPCRELMACFAGEYDTADELIARVERVLALHGAPTPSEAKFADLCLACGELWPCPTVRLLNGEEK